MSWKLRWQYQAQPCLVGYRMSRCSSCRYTSCPADCYLPSALGLPRLPGGEPHTLPLSLELLLRWNLSMHQEYCSWSCIHPQDVCRVYRSMRFAYDKYNPEHPKI